VRGESSHCQSPDAAHPPQRTRCVLCSRGSPRTSSRTALTAPAALFRGTVGVVQYGPPSRRRSTSPGSGPARIMGRQAPSAQGRGNRCRAAPPRPDRDEFTCLPDANTGSIRGNRAGRSKPLSGTGSRSGGAADHGRMGRTAPRMDGTASILAERSDGRGVRGDTDAGSPPSDGRRSDRVAPGGAGPAACTQ